jgi:hypothetical protein
MVTRQDGLIVQPFKVSKHGTNFIIFDILLTVYHYVSQ